ncbi:MAG: Crp/Fnr family transcriptional regulator [Firmicutes bacterium]|nr:Crp/Fnr family transcriptional regulator [Bacillota bacterium]
MSESNYTIQADKDYLYHLLYIPRGIERLEKLGRREIVPKDTILNEIDEIPDFCYVVRSGQVLCYEISYAGDQRVYNIMEPGSLFLEECMLFDKPCPIQFRTLDQCELIRIEKCDLKRALKRDIDIVMDVCESLSTKFLSAMEHLRLGPRQSASWKICKMLLIYIAHYGKQQEDGSWLLSRRFSHQMIADILGLNRVTVTRKLKELKELGLVDSADGVLRFPDIHALEEHMQGLEISE